jgi:hypothetical protein
MPYIKQNEREELFTNAEYNLPENAGQLNFMLTQTCINYIDHMGKKYQTINDVLGALEGAKLEFYRRLAAPYEDKKIIENGDVYE